MQVTEAVRHFGVSRASITIWRKKYAGLEVSDAKRLKARIVLGAERNRAREFWVNSLEIHNVHNSLRFLTTRRGASQG